MRLVILESPYAGNVEQNLAYARRCVRDSLNRGESPIASHLLYTQPGILDDNNLEERNLGIRAGLSWILLADAMVVYKDLGISPGMERGIVEASFYHVKVEFRSLKEPFKG